MILVSHRFISMRRLGRMETDGDPPDIRNSMHEDTPQNEPAIDPEPGTVKVRAYCLREKDPGLHLCSLRGPAVQYDRSYLSVVITLTELASAP